MTRVSVCLCITGARAYYRAGTQAIRSYLNASQFDVLVVCDRGRGRRLPRDPRVQVLEMDVEDPRHRSAPFLLKFEALALCLEQTRSEYVVLADADTLLVAPLEVSDVASALDGCPLGMVEQTTIRGSEMKRPEFLRHYVEHTMVLLGQGEPLPALEDFRFYNSGVVLGLRSELEAVTSWARETMRSIGPEHQVGEHMIADQDYFQYWANNLHPGSCRMLPWPWNHCEHWDSGFPREGAYILHFSNFCQGPSFMNMGKMWAARRLGGLRRPRGA